MKRFSKKKTRLGDGEHPLAEIMENSSDPITPEVNSGPNLITIRINVERTEDVVCGLD